MYVQIFFFMRCDLIQLNLSILQIWRHIQPGGDATGADVMVELREGQGLLKLRLEFDAGSPLGRATSFSTLNRSPFGSPSRFSLSRRSPTDE